MTTRLRNLAALAAVVGAVVLVLGAFVDAKRTAFAYMTAFAFAFSIAVCGLGFLMIGYATHARWFVVMRRLCESIAVTVPLFILLFVPIAIGMKTFYLWADDPSKWSTHVSDVIHKRGAWHSPVFFLARAAFYLFTVSGVAFILRRFSLAEERAFDPERRQMARVIGGGGLPVIGLVLSFAAWDWIMSLDPTWYSNIYGLYVFGGGFQSAIALLAILVYAARVRALVPKEVSAPHFHALGNLMLAMTIFWAWMAFAQLLIIWIADIPDESIFYVTRWTGFWCGASVLLVVGHFALPFLLLLQRPLKRSGAPLARIAVWILCMHYVDMYWLIIPIVRPTGMPLHWVDLGALLFVVGSTVAFGAWRFAAAPPVPLKDPGLPASLKWEMT